ncbi:hypothetical protein COL922a_013227 [Colletotrichum nupharicola]|nr:hypothetical protein COL922a_013227 [Colletotrichum nupharicola]
MAPALIGPVDVDVVIVGAGLSGLCAAVDIHKSGLSYVVLEAMDRVGGKTLSVPDSPQEVADLDDKQQAQLYEAFGQMAVLVDRSDPEMPWLGHDGKRTDSLTLAELGEKEIGGGIGSVVLNVLSRACLGLESSEVGALPVIDYVKAGTGLENISSDLKDSAQYLRNRQDKSYECIPASLVRANVGFRKSEILNPACRKSQRRGSQALNADNQDYSIG